MKTGTKMQKVMALAFSAVAAATMMTTPAMAADFHREAQLPAVQRTQPQQDFHFRGMEQDFHFRGGMEQDFHFRGMQLPAVQKSQPQQDFHFRGGMQLPAVQKTQPKVEPAAGDLSTPVVEEQTLLLPAIQSAREAAQSSSGPHVSEMIITKQMD